jgi:hypothetical protein
VEYLTHSAFHVKAGKKAIRSTDSDNRRSDIASRPLASPLCNFGRCGICGRNGEQDLSLGLFNLDQQLVCVSADRWFASLLQIGRPGKCD